MGELCTVDADNAPTRHSSIRYIFDHLDLILQGAFEGISFNPSLKFEWGLYSRHYYNHYYRDSKVHLYVIIIPT